jgi:hypothetical protein
MDPTSGRLAGDRSSRPAPTEPPATERARRRLARQLAHAQTVRAWADARIRELIAELGDAVAP